MKRAARNGRSPTNGRSNGSGAVVVLTREQLEERAEHAAQELLSVSRDRAFKMLEAGKLRGTLAEAVLTPMRDLLAS